MHRRKVTIDGNEAAAHVAYRTNEVIAIYPITPSSTMGELADAWAAQRLPNLWGTVPIVQEMQSEGGAAGVIHGALQTGSLATTFTASQGLLLMIPNMYKIAGELTPTVFHIAARSLATHALSIFGDHSDVMATRSAGWAILFANSVQEVMDFALISQAATLKARIPFLHVFDGFRTSHEVMKISQLTDDDLRALIDPAAVHAHRTRALSSEHPVIRGTAHNPDTFFQARETVNRFYLDTPGIVQGVMDDFAKQVGRKYHLFDYVGHKHPDRVLVMMGSGCETAEETVAHLNAHGGEKVGLLKVRLFRPFSVEHLLAGIPESVRAVAVLDRTKEPGAIGEPLYEDVVTAFAEGARTGRAMPTIIGGRYGLSSKEFTPAMVKAVFDELSAVNPNNHFTVGILDDVTGTSLEFDPTFQIESPDTVRAIFWGLGSDGTVGANKNTIKIIGEGTGLHAQGYFVYDSKKSGARTISHLRFGAHPIKSTYLIQSANFIAVHQFGFLTKYPVLEQAAPGATFLLNSPFGPNEVWNELPADIQQTMLEKKMRLFVIDGSKVARDAGMGNRVNTVMQTCFFALSGVLPRQKAIEKIAESIRKTYGKRGKAVVEKNLKAVEATLANLFQVTVPTQVTGAPHLPSAVPGQAPAFVREVTARMIAGQGDQLPVSAFPVDGTYPTATSQWEKRGLAETIPVWDTDLCIQCGKCVMVCPHAAIRSKVYHADLVSDDLPAFKHTEARFRELPGERFSLQVSPDDCTGCRLCFEICPVHDKASPDRRALNMESYDLHRAMEVRNWEFFLTLPDFPRTGTLKFDSVKNLQLLRPLFEFSGACSGCGETPYLKLMSQLFGDRALVANATGCSSIFGGNLPTTPWSINAEGRGPAWANSLFEDNAEFGLGMRLTLDKQGEYARELLRRLRPELGDPLVEDLLANPQNDEADIMRQRDLVAELKKRLAERKDAPSVDLLYLADILVKRSVWIVGGDGWAYDIGFGGLDHVLTSGRDINILVLDTEVYSNTGGQASKATPEAAVAKFAAGGKSTGKKDLAWIAINYGNVYVAQVAMGGSDIQTLKAFQEAEAYDGPSLIIAYSHCIAHGIDMSQGLHQQKLAVDVGHWPLFRFNPTMRDRGENPLHLDSRPPKLPLEEYAYHEARYEMLTHSDPETAERLIHEAQDAITAKWKRYEQLAEKFSQKAVSSGD